MMSNGIIGYMYGVVDYQRNVLAEEDITGCWLTSSSVFIYEKLFQGFLSTIYIQIFLVWMSFAEQIRFIYHVTDPFKIAYIGYMNFVEKETKEKLESADGVKRIVRLWKSLHELNQVAYDPMTILLSLVAGGSFLLGFNWGASSSSSDEESDEGRSILDVFSLVVYAGYFLTVWYFLVKLGGREAIYKLPYREEDENLLQFRMVLFVLVFAVPAGFVFFLYKEHIKFI